MSRPVIHGYAIVSEDDRIADASGAMPPSLRNEADWTYFQAGLDVSDWVALGRLSHEAAPNPKRRRRLVVSQSAQGLEHREDGAWWRPGAVGFSEVAQRLLPRGGRVAVPGGQGVFDLFREHGYDAFHLARAEGVTLPGGRGLFAASEAGESADNTLLGAGLTAGPRRWLDKTARVYLQVYLRA